MDKSKVAQLKVIIRQIVNEELEVVIPELITEIKKVVDNRVAVLLEEANKKSPRPITEAVEPTSRITKQKIAEMIGVSFDPNSDTIRASTRTMSSPQPPSQPPASEEVVRAITRDYSDLMTKLNELRPDVKGVYRV